MNEHTSVTVSALLQENRVFHPISDFKKNAFINDPSVYQEAARDREAFWAKQAEQLSWFQKWHTVLKWDPPFSQWFVGGKINVSYNCLDRHQSLLAHKKALIWEGENGDQKILTYRDLFLEVNKFSNVLKSLGIQKGDRIAIYMPLIPEAVVAMLACTRVGAIHTVVFGGFSSESLKDRINDSSAKVLITADGGYRRGSVIALKELSDQALQGTPTIEKVVVVHRTGSKVSMLQGRDYWYHELMKNADVFCEPEKMDSEDMLFILYTSGTTGKPKGIIHTTGGYLTGVTVTTQWVFDLKPEDVYWCTADVGWITGHSYVVYGPLANGATQVIYEGSPDYPDRSRFWKIIEKYKVSILYTAPTAIRTFMKWGTDWVNQSDLSSLRLLGSVGEPINPEAWMWYYTNIGKEKCPVVDTWWQTETGMILISPLPGITPLKPGSATRPLPGIEAKVLTEDGKVIEKGGGYLALTAPWPAMLRGIYGDPDRFKKQYWSKWSDDIYFTGDGAKLDDDGYYWLLGRVDDVMNIAGHRVGTMEVESALVDHPKVAEAAVVGISDDIKGQAIAAFVILKEGIPMSADMEDILKQHVVQKIGAIARPKKIILSTDLPKTRSGKIMRRLLRDVAEGRVLGDVTTLADASIIATLKQKYDEEK